MKKSIKKLIVVFAIGVVSAFAFTGCDAKDFLEEKINQARCEHEWNDGEVTKAATCTEKGELTKTCTLCEKVETEEIELAEHIAVYVQAVTPTCLEKGVTDGTVCSVCETKISGFQEIPALGHIVVKDSAVKPTCLETGLTEGEHCSRCLEVLKTQEKVPATGHNLVVLEAVEPTCTTEGKTQGVWCDKCKDVFAAQEIIPVLEHSYDDGVITKDATCTVEGERIFTCVSCGTTYREPIAKIAHSDINEDGKCDYCGDVLLPVAETGELVAGNTYRVYYQQDGNVIYVKLSSSTTTYFYFNRDRSENAYLWWGGSSGPIYYLEGLEIVKTDNYFEFTLKAGTYKILHKDGTDTGDTFVIDEATTFTKCSGAYRVV